MAETVEVEIKVKSNIDQETDKVTEGIGKIQDKADSAGDSFTSLGEAGKGGLDIIDEAFGGIGSRVVKVIQGVKQLGAGLVSSFKAGIQGAKGLKTAIAATGIGLLVAAVATVATYWDDIVGSTKDEVSAIDEAIQSATRMRQEQEGILNILLNSDNILREQGKTEQEILDLKKAQTEELIKAYEVEVATLKVKAEQQKAEEASLREAYAQLVKIGGSLGGAGKVTESGFQAFAESEGYSFEAAQQLAEAEAALNALNNTAAGYRESEREAEKKAVEDAAETRKKAYEKAQADLEKHNQTLKKLQDDARDSEMSRIEAAEKDDLVRENLRFVNEGKRLSAQRADEIKEAEGNAELINAINEKYNQLGLAATQTHNDNVAAINKTREQEELTRTQRAEDLKLELIEEGQEKELAAIDIKYERLMAAEVGNAEALILLEKLKAKEIAAIQDKAATDELARIQALNDFKIQAALDTINVFKDFNALFNKDNEEASRKAFLREKALNLAETVITTYTAAQKAYTSQLNPLDPTSLVRAQVAAGITLAGGLARAAAIAKQKFEPSGGSTSIPSAIPSQSVPNAQALTPQFNIVGTSGTNQLAQSIGSQFDRPLRAYVVGGDVTTSQELERKRIKIATFG
jgi:hypothetical protein